MPEGAGPAVGPAEGAEEEIEEGALSLGMEEVTASELPGADEGKAEDGSMLGGAAEEKDEGCSRLD